MPGPTDDIDRLLKEIQGSSRHHQDESHDKALLGGRDDPSQRLDYVNNYGQSQATRNEPYISEDLVEELQSNRINIPSRSTAHNRLSLRHPFETPPSKLAAAPSSPAYPAPSSPLAGIVQRREAQASQSNLHPPPSTGSTSTFPSFRNQSVRDSTSSINLRHAPPIVQGIQLVSPDELPDRFRSVFPFPLFNAVQSKCFSTAYRTSDNLVLSAPTGSGKTVILELSICQLMSGFQTDQLKIVYMAPTKSLCAERQKDWQAKFATLDLQCAELTGDTDHGQLRMVQNAGIIITTPEKWDSMTRKWKDHAKLMQLVKLFLIDEVHILNETRGACLEAVVSRMKSVGSNVRFIALSATVPNSDDIATWLGLNPTTQHLPAYRERFGEEFRPVKLQKFVYGLSFGGNDWAFDKVCDPKLPEIITKHSQKKPIMVFCVTRKSTVSTAKLLANWWTTKGVRDRQWAGPTFKLVAQDPDLKGTLSAGVAFHHAGLDPSDRHVIEKGFLEGQVNVICCTSTLAVGVNLPCHMVIIKNTMCFQEEGLKEYADLEIMQMLGRAGRPQFEDSAVAVIITKQEKLQKYEKMVSGQELLESRLVAVEDKNAEIGLGTIYNLYTAKRWLAGTFLYVRLAQNPAHYKLDGDATNLSLEDRIERVCQRDIDLLLDTQLVSDEGDKVKCTEFGDAMARYYVKFETMKALLSLEPRSKMSDIASNNQAPIATEKKLLKEINGSNGIKYPIKIDIALSEHKRSLVIQSELGGVDFPADEQYNKFKRQHQQDKNTIFNHIHRLIRCVIDCQIYLQDAVTVRHALELARGFAARVWDNSPYQMKQVPNVGPAAVRRLANGGIHSIESLEAAEPHKIEMLMSKHPPFGSRVLATLKDFPKLRVSIKMTDKDVKPGQPVRIKLKAEVGFMNMKPPTHFNRKAVNVCFLAERSDGNLIDFRRVSAMKLNNGQDILLSVDLIQQTQFVTCYVMCDEIAGTMRYAELKPDLPSSMFPALPSIMDQGQKVNQLAGKGCDSTSTVPKKKSSIVSPATVLGDESLYDDGVVDADMFEAGKFLALLDFCPIESFESEDKSGAPRSKARNDQRNNNDEADSHEWTPTKLENGKWACNHKCKDKKAHLCCHEGVDKPPKAPKKVATTVASTEESSSKALSRSHPKQSNVQSKLHTGKPVAPSDRKDVETVGLAWKRDPNEYAKVAPRAYRSLHQLHEKVTKDDRTPTITSIKPCFSYKKGEQPTFSFIDTTASSTKRNEHPSSDYGSGWIDDLPSPSALIHTDHQAKGGLDSDGLVDDDFSSDRGIFTSERHQLDNDRGYIEDSQIMDSSDTNTAIFADLEYEEAMRTLNPEDDLEASRYFKNGLPKQSVKPTSHDKLFVSTDSPEKPSSPPPKRKAAESRIDEPDEAIPVHEVKKQKIDAVSNSPPVLQSSSGKENQISKPAPTIRPGHLERGYKFDEAFIAELEPYVEFV
ncbi:MAG: hypothetical protein Q9166_001312 [cf. Caloplaca sp. 2 TL-2023]